MNHHFLLGGLKLKLLPAHSLSLSRTSNQPRLEAKEVLIKYYTATESVSVPLGLVGSLHGLNGNEEIAACCLLGCLEGVCKKGEKWLKAGVVEECLNILVNQVWSDEVYRSCAGVICVASSSSERGRSRVGEYVKKVAYMKALADGRKGEFVQNFLGDREAVVYARRRLEGEAKVMWARREEKRRSR